MTRRSTPTVRMAAVAAAAALALSACTPGSNIPSSEGEADPNREVSTDVAGLGDITLTIWDQEVRGGQDEQMTQLNEAFQELYPNVTIDRNSQSFDDLGTTLRLALTGDDAPDVVQANNGRSDMGAFVSAGQLISLEPYAEAYGWKERYPESVLQYSTYSEDGATFGEGNVYGLPQVGEAVGVYYSKSKLEELGVALPETWEEFEAALATAEEAGEVPIHLGNLEQWPALHVFGPIQGTQTAVEEITALGLGNEGASWTTPENTAAATTLADWASAGYLGEAPNGTAYDDAWSAFAEGEGVFLVAGSWLAAGLDTEMGEDVGFMAPPPAQAGDAPVTTGGTGLPFAVTSGSDTPDAAAAYVDFITSAEAMQILADTGNVPVLETASFAPESGVLKDVFEVYGSVTSEGSLLPYLDYATPTMGETLGASLQGLIAGQLTAEEFLQEAQTDYEEFTGSGS
ncbi:extracellular solute-binding protein [Arthrobacter sp. H5]|uniref:extracellular solute-binding protein n=1 Tax=Arthrobacter sp. H5 TaxID=1267973 RepID=UPI000483151B|nr:extracellular solute-binding protein [Arthrobacter sp. H5]